jgi:hypothetical protein
VVMSVMGCSRPIALGAREEGRGGYTEMFAFVSWMVMRSYDLDYWMIVEMVLLYRFTILSVLGSIVTVFKTKCLLRCNLVKPMYATYKA